MRNLARWLVGFPGATCCRQIRDLARLLPTISRESAQALAVVTPVSDISPELTGQATVLD
jgi:hypothetical protein